MLWLRSEYLRRATYIFKAAKQQTLHNFCGYRQACRNVGRAGGADFLKGTFNTVCTVIIRGGVLEDVLGLEDVLEDRFWSPWPWPRDLKSSKIGLSSTRGQHYISGMLKFCGAVEKFFGKRFLVEIAWKIFVKTFLFFFLFFIFWRSPEKFLWRPFFFFFWRALALCVLGPWPRAFLSLASRVSVLGKAVLGLGLEPCVLDSTSGHYHQLCSQYCQTIKHFNKARVLKH